jgi:ribonucleoside-diphosphate reductase alpha chain
MAPFVCQSMSLNMYLEEPDLPKILRFLIEGWREGLRSGLYYCHTMPAAGSQKTSVRAESPQEAASGDSGEACPIDGSCTSCAL